MFLMIDNYDSFVYNLLRYFEELGQEIIIKRNDEISLEQIRQMKPEGIIISPGPGTPEDAGISLDVIKDFAGKIPILGVCLGHQAIAHAFGGKIVKGIQPMHGKISEVIHDGEGLFRDIKNSLKVTRYHSLIVEKETVPNCLKVTCETADGVIMGLRHKEFPIEGVQFHPEAELSECGHDILRNFIRLNSG